MHFKDSDNATPRYFNSCKNTVVDQNKSDIATKIINADKFILLLLIPQGSKTAQCPCPRKQPNTPSRTDFLHPVINDTEHTSSRWHWIRNFFFFEDVKTSQAFRDVSVKEPVIHVRVPQDLLKCRVCWKIRRKRKAKSHRPFQKNI